MEPQGHPIRVKLNEEGLSVRCHCFPLSASQYYLLIFGLSESDFSDLMHPSKFRSPKTLRKPLAASWESPAERLLEKNILLKEQYESTRKDSLKLEMELQARSRKEAMLLEEINSLAGKNATLQSELENLVENMYKAKEDFGRESRLMKEKQAALEEALAYQKLINENDMKTARAEIKSRDGLIRDKDRKLQQLSEELQDLKKQVSAVKEVKDKRDEQFNAMLSRIEESHSALLQAKLDNEFLRQNIQQSRDMNKRLVDELERASQQRRFDIKEDSTGAAKGYFSSKAKNDGLLRAEEASMKTKQIVEYVKLRELISEKTLKSEKKACQDISQLSTAAYSTHPLPLLDQIDKFHDGSLFSVQLSPINSQKAVSIVLDCTTELYLRQLLKLVQSHIAPVQNYPITSPFNLTSYLYFILSASASTDKENIKPRTNHSLK